MKKIKHYILRRLGILELKKQCSSIKEKNEELENKIRELEYLNSNLVNEIIPRIGDAEKLIYKECMGLNDKKRDFRIIVSMTSFPVRINYAHIILSRMLSQTLKPDKIILWLSKEQFPMRENELPDSLLKMRNYGVEIEWCDGDIKAYKKILPALKQFPDDLVVIVDDDLIYPTDHLQKLYEAHLKFPNAIIASRVHRILLGKSKELLSYKLWEKECLFDRNQIRSDWFFTGGAGTLFPPHIFSNDFFDEEVIVNLCPLADDIWLNIHAAINHVPIVNTATNAILRRVEGTQQVCLEHINVDQGKNDTQLKNVIMYYREELKGSIYEKLQMEDTCMKNNKTEINKISVIVPITHSHNYLKDCLESLVRQTLNDIEIICVNAAGKCTEAIVNEYVKNYSNVTLINQLNASKGTLQNIGLDAATGKYIYYMESSGLLLSTALEELWTISEERELDLLCFSGIVFSNTVYLSNRTDCEALYLIKGECPGVLSGRELLKVLSLYSNNRMPINLQLIRRDLFVEKCSFHLEGDINGGELCAFILSMNAEHCFWINDIYLYIRIFDNSDIINEDNAIQKEMQQLQEELYEIKRLFYDMENSKSFKIGRVITAIPRKIRDWIKQK